MIYVLHKKYAYIIKMTWIQALEYKANTLVGAFAIFSGLIIEYLIWNQIYSTEGVVEIRGFTFPGLMVYIFLSMMVGQLKSSWATSLEMIDSIRSGELNKFLIRPISFYIYHLMMFVGYNSLFYIVYFIALLFFPIIFPGWIFSTLLQIIGFIAALTISIYLSYSIYYCMVCIAFWFGEVRSLLIAYNVANIILSGQIIPLRMFPQSIQEIIYFTPLKYLIDFPVSIATGSLPINVWGFNFLVAICWCLTMTFLGKLIYNNGIQVYEGYGS